MTNFPLVDQLRKIIFGELELNLGENGKSFVSCFGNSGILSCKDKLSALYGSSLTIMYGRGFPSV